MRCGVSNLLFIMDGEDPTVSTNANPGDVLGINSSIGYTCNDNSSATTVGIQYYHNNGSASIGESFPERDTTTPLN